MQLTGLLHSPDHIISPRAYARATFRQYPDTVERHNDTSIRFYYEDYQGGLDDLTYGDTRNITLDDGER